MTKRGGTPASHTGGRFRRSRRRREKATDAHQCGIGKSNTRLLASSAITAKFEKRFDGRGEQRQRPRCRSVALV
jgi:hypothetical protein